MRRHTATAWISVLLYLQLTTSLSEATGERFLHLPDQQLSPGASDISTSAGSAIQCALRCLGSVGCLSANYLPPAGGAGSCQLRHESSGQLQSAAAGAAALRLPASCRQLQRVGYRADGVYRTHGLPAPLYCDMTLTMGGGWTLLVAFNSHAGWDLTSIMERNPDTPTLTDNYSILRVGDKIRDLETTPYFKYR